LIYCAIFLSITTFLSYKALVTARATNLRWASEQTKLTGNFHPGTEEQLSDYRQLQMTAVFFREGSCEIGHLNKCDSRNSEIVDTIKAGPLPPTTTALLHQYSYTSLFNLFKELSLLGRDDEVVSIATKTKVDIYSLSLFAVEWYLRPAVAYATANRELDAVKYYRLFNGVLRPHIKNGDWLSMEGIDATDLPVLTDIFCPDDTSAASSLCMVGILRALEDHVGDTIGNGIPVKDFISSYDRLNPILRSAKLTDYLRLWTLTGMKQPLAQPSGLNAVQLSAWRYASGVMIRQTAFNGTSVEECERLLKVSMNGFKIIVAHGSAGDYFSDPAENQIQYLGDQTGSLCQEKIASKKSPK
jgi:hypothetical protein